MPIYEFICPSCRKVHEFLVRGSDSEGKKPCPSCGETGLEKLMSSASISVSGRENTGSANSSCSRHSCTGCTSRCR